MQRFVLALIASCCLAMAAAAPAEITIYASDTYRPISWLDEQGNPKGIALEAIDFVQKDTGLKLKAELLPWNRAYNLAKHGLGGIIGISFTPERAELFDYSPVLFDSGITLVMHKNRQIRYQSVADLSGKRIGALIGVSYGAELDQAAKNGVFEFVRDSSHSARLKNLLIGRIDAALFANAPAGLSQFVANDPELKAHADEFLVFTKLFKDPIHIAFRKGSLDQATRSRLFQSFEKWAKQRESR
ncbi:ABC transporter substrate-binding protein [Chitinibacter sp. GC72]|uniref:substrate-binding periplasmic protein n=1 Tax=Chitinibacter sp. GC72 TaxID=1526917 RepID=UPI0012F8832A|nr:transporter substrate-binding domain-containing protein [Chitinibacter sp. GC72]